jgi:electron transfer flavoprotein beta subunit
MSAHIVVCIKAVMLDAPKGKAVRTVDFCDMNPFDRPALELGIQLRDQWGGQVTALSMGPGSCAFALCDALAMGADRGVLVSDPSLVGSDTLVTSTVLSAAIRRLDPVDLVLFGVRTSDSDTAQVGPQTAVSLDLPLVTGVFSVEKDAGGLRVQRSIDGYLETYDLALPAALTVQPGAVQPRDLGLQGIASAYDRENPVETWRISDIGLTPDTVGEGGSPTRVAAMSKIRRDRQCDYISGEIEEQADTLIQRLTTAGFIG